MQHESDRQYVERLIAQYDLFYFFEFRNDDGHPVHVMVVSDTQYPLDTDPAISADVVTKQFVLYREVCYRNNNPTHSLYLYDYPSGQSVWFFNQSIIA